MDLRRLVGRALVGGLCVSGAVAVIALLSGSFDEIHWRVVGTSLGFSIFTCTAAAGAGLRTRSHEGLRRLGLATVAASLASLVTLFAALWIDDVDALWRAFGVAGLAALWTSHASLMLGALRPSDTPAVRALSQISAFTLGIETAVGVGAILEVVTDIGEAAPRVLAALIVVTVVSTVLAPLLRRMQSTTAPSQAAVAVGRGSGFAAEVAESAQRLSTMDLPAQARAEVDHLRRIARDAGG
jgi:hypothetical protein